MFFLYLSACKGNTEKKPGLQKQPFFTKTDGTEDKNVYYLPF